MIKKYNKSLSPTIDASLRFGIQWQASSDR